MSKRIENLCVDVMKELKCNGRLEDLGKLILHREDLEDMFHFVWNMPEFHKCLVPEMLISAKTHKEAENLLSDGNIAFQYQLYKEALELYNLCIMKAPHPDIKLKDNVKFNSEERTNNELLILSSAYEKRSELLFELKQYKMCITDIDHAIRNGIAESMHKELHERKNDCLVALNSGSECNSIKDKIRVIDETKYEGQVNEPRIGDNYQTNLHNVGILSKTKEELLFCYKCPSPPKLAEVNLKIPCLSNSLEVKYNALKGRFIQARRDIHPGEVVLVEEPYMCFPNTTEEVLRNCCCNCLQRCHAPIPCRNCQIVVFCDESCRASAMSNFHRVECKYLATCISLGIDNNAIVACRLIIKTTFKTLKEMVPQLKMEKLEKSRENQGFNRNGNYIPTDYRTIYHLEGNIMERSMLDIFHKAAKAFLLIQMLLLSKCFFTDESGKPIDPDLEDIIMIGSSLLNHTFSIPQNIFSITEFQLNLDNFKEENTQKGIGEGVYSIASLFNHSCNVNTMRCHYGNIMVIYAKSFIPFGTELTTCYKHHYHIKEIKERRKELHKDYKFLCFCDACLYDWPLLKDLSTNPKISIEKVKHLTNDNFTLDERVLENQLNELLKGYSSAFKSIRKIESSNDKEIDIFELKMIETIEFMDKFIDLPCKEYVVAQMMLKHCFARKASSYCFRR